MKSVNIFYREKKSGKIWFLKSSVIFIKKQHLSQTGYHIQQLQKIKYIQHGVVVQVSLILQK